MDPADVHSVSGQCRSIHEHQICAHNVLFFIIIILAAGSRDTKTLHMKGLSVGEKEKIHARQGRTFRSGARLTNKPLL